MSLSRKAKEKRRFERVAAVVEAQHGAPELTPDAARAILAAAKAGQVRVDRSEIEFCASGRYSAKLEIVVAS